MTKGTKIAIGVFATLAVGGLITWLVLKPKKPEEEKEWEDSDVDAEVETTLTPEKKKKIAEQKKKNNFTEVKKYFGSRATNYPNRIVYKTDENKLAKKLGLTKIIGGNTISLTERTRLKNLGLWTQLDDFLFGKTTTQTQSYGLSGGEISVVYWEDGHFTVKIGNTKAAIQGYYYKGGRIIRVTKGKGMFASKAGIREVDNDRLIAIGRVFAR